MSTTHFAKQIESLYKGQIDFATLAIDIFRYQAQENKVYKDYLNLININPSSIQNVADIPCLPISLFKNKDLISGGWLPKMKFTSSGTAGVQSKHHVKSPEFYLQNTVLGFENFFGEIKEHCFLALLPSYLEREGSSLVYMLSHFIEKSKYEESGFYLNQFEELRTTLLSCIEKGIPTILFGVPFGLLDFGEWQSMDLSQVTIFETGGMKGRREELTKAQLYTLLEEYFKPKAIYSEYGMTEMFSQAYSVEPGIFKCAPSLDVFIREINDPYNYLNFGRIGAINVIDLANFDSISFIATDDLGRKKADGTFEVLGRLDNSDLRGCNLLIQDIEL